MAVFTELSLDSVRGDLSAFGLHDLTSMVGLLEGIENSTYMLMNAQNQFILTIFERRVTEADLPFFDQLMTLMRDGGVSVPRLLRADDGRCCFYVESKLCVIQSFLKGVIKNIPAERDCYNAGQTLAKMHLAAARSGLEKPNPVGRESWLPMFERVVRHLNDDWALRVGWIYTLLEQIEMDWPESLPGGPVHADYFKENILFGLNGEVNVFDFFLGCRELYAYDLALALTSWGFSDDGIFLRNAFDSFLLGYTTKRPLTTVECYSLPLLLKAGSVRILMTRLTDEHCGRHPNVKSDKKPSEYWRKIREIDKLEKSGRLNVLLQTSTLQKQL